MFYLTIVFRDADSFGFIIPDVPGFTADIETTDFDHAVAQARTILTSHLAALVDAGGTIPVARAMNDVRNDARFAEDFATADAIMMLPALLPAGRTVRVNLTMDENTVDLIDQAASERKLSRSAFVAEAARRMAMA